MHSRSSLLGWLFAVAGVGQLAFDRAHAAAVAWQPGGHVMPLISGQPANPWLFWTAGPGNELENGGFELGLTAPWTVQPGSGSAFVENRGTNISGVPLLEGTRGAVLSGQVPNGSTCSLLQEVAVPADVTSAILSWLVWTDAGAPTAARELAVEVRSTAGEWLATPFRADRLRLPHRETWRVGADLAAFAGQTVRLEFRATVASSARLQLDDIRLQVAPVEDLEFEVYFARGISVGPTDLVARVPDFGWQAQDLVPSQTYTWQIVARRGDQRVPGPVWKFRAAQRTGFDRFDVQLHHDPPVAGEPVPFEVVALDALHFTPTDAPAPGVGVLQTAAVADGRSAPGVRITEVAVAQARSTNAVECANLSADPVDVSDWQVWCYYSGSPSSAPTRFRVPAGTTLTPGAWFVLRANGTSPGTFPNFLAGQPIGWSVGAEFDRVGVVLLDAATNVVDFVNAWNTDAGSVTNPIPFPMESWVGPAIGLTAPNRLAYERVGGIDTAGAEGWRLAPSNSLGQINSDLIIPFQPGPGRLPLDPLRVTNAATGVWTGEFTFPEPGAHVRVGVRDNRGRTSFSEPLAVRPLPVITLELPPLLVESDPPPRYTGGVRLRRPAAVDLTVQLAAEPAPRLRVLAPAVLRAGETTAEFAFEVVNDLLPQIPVTATFTGTAVGWEVRPATTLLADDEPLTLSWRVGSQVMEGASQTATLLASSPSPGPLSIRLSSTEPSVIKLPRSVILPAGATEVTFEIRAYEDDLLTGLQTVELRAEVPGQSIARTTVTVPDNEPRLLTLVLPPRISEADGSAQSGTVRLGGRAAEAVSVTLTSEDPSELVLPAQVVIPVGQDRIGFPLTVPDDPDQDGTRPVLVSATAAGFDGATARTEVADNDPHSFRFEGSAEVHFAGQALPLTITALDLNGEIIPTFAGSVTLAATGAGGQLAIVPEVSGAFSGGSWSGEVTLDRSDPAVQVRATGEGVEGVSPPFRVLPDPVRHRLVIAAADLAWSPQLGRLLASVAETDPTFPNRIVTIDPLTGAVAPLVALARIRQVSPDNEPGEGRLAVSPDGTMLYVGIEGGSLLRQYALPAGTFVREFPVGTNDDGSASIAFDWQVAGDPGRVVLARTDGINLGSVAVYDQGVLRAGRGPYSSHVQLAPDGQTGFSYMGRALGDLLFRFALTPEGVADTVLLPKSPLWFGGDVRLDRGLIHFASGPVYDPAVPGWAGGFPVAGLVTQYANEGRMAFSEDGRWIWSASGNGRGGLLLEWFARASRQAMRRVSLSSVSDRPRRLWLCGPDTLALHAGEVVCVLHSSTFLPAGGSVDLALDYRPSASVAVAGRPFEYIVAIANLSPNPATDVFLDQRLPAGVTFLHAIPSQGSWSGQAAAGRAALGDLAPGAGAEVRISVLPQRGGWWFHDLMTVANEWDPAPDNNRSQARVSARLDLARDSSGLLSLGARGLAVAPSGQRFYASVGSDGGPWADRVLVLDGSTGEILDVLEPGRNPDRLAVSSDGRFLYVAVNDATAVSRIDLGTGSVDLRWSLGLTPDHWVLSVTDLHTVPARPESVALLLRASLAGAGSAGAGIAIYDREVRRPLLGLNADYVASSTMVFNADGTALYGAGTLNAHLEHFQVDTTGVTLTHRALEVLGPNGTISLDFALGRIMSSDGRFIDPAGLESFQLGVAGGAQHGVFHPTAGRAAYVRWPSGVLEVWDPVSRTLLASTSLPALDDFIGDVLPLSADRLALRVNNGDVHVVRSSFLLPPTWDSDGDGMPDLWELAHTLDPDQGAPGLDSDQDGVTDRDEYVAGTHPRQPADLPRVAVTANSDRTLQLEILGAAGRRYQWEQRTSLDHGSWEAVGPEQSGQGATLVLPLTPESGVARFHRVRIRLGP